MYNPLLGETPQTYNLFSIIGQGRKHRYVLLVLIATEEEARKVAKDWLGRDGLLTVNQNSGPDYDLASKTAGGHRDIDEIWFYNNATGNWFQIS